jgi:hypothetical protein
MFEQLRDELRTTIEEAKRQQPEDTAEARAFEILEMRLRGNVCPGARSCPRHRW